MLKQYINPPDMHPTAGYAHAVRVGNTVYLAGAISKNDKDEWIGLGDVEKQAEQVFENIGHLLAAAGATFDDIVKLVTYAMSSDYRLPILRVRDRYLKRQTYVSTFVVPRALALPELLVEIEAVAVTESTPEG